MITLILLIAGFLITVITLIASLFAGAAVFVLVFADIVIFGLGIAFVIKAICDKKESPKK